MDGVGGVNAAESTDLELGSDANYVASGLECLAGRSGAGLSSEGMADALSALADDACLTGCCQRRSLNSCSHTFGQSGGDLKERISAVHRALRALRCTTQVP